MKLNPLLLVVALVFVGPIAARAEPVVVVDGWWSGDFAKAGCEQAKKYMQENRSLINQFGCDAVTACLDMMPRYTACTVGDPVAVVQNFETDLMSQFAINPACRGATFFRYHGPSVTPSAEQQAEISKPHWALIIDYTVGLSAQSWSLQNNGVATQGEGGATKIAADVCAIVMGHGGTLGR